jgi:prepilin-type N-terminal cleavage/methylation domain-containing protein
MRKMKLLKKSKTAFSLIELSIVILIISILISGILSNSVSSVNNARVRTTNERLQQIYQAMGNYLVKNNSLPCPAVIAAIIYTSNTAAKLVYGMVPVRDLGLADEMAEDGFGDKIAYVVNSDFTSNTTFGDNTLNISANNITLNDKPGGVTHTITDNAIFALISYGSNKFGAFPANAAVQNEGSVDDTDEQGNYISGISGATADFGPAFVASSSSSQIFDDVILGKTRDQMVQDFSAFSTIFCAADPGVLDSYSWGQGKYGEAVVATSPACGDSSYPIKKCGAFGVWGPITQACSP